MKDTSKSSLRTSLYYLILVALIQVPTSAQVKTTVTLLHFSDYHSHALPFYSEGDSDVAGIARAIAYLHPFCQDSSSLIFSGGDMINHGSPAWSDKYPCVEWPWFNGIVDAMAFGNHDADYGSLKFERAASELDYPILASNVLDSLGNPLFQRNGKTYEVYSIGAVKIGVFAIVGPDFRHLLKPETMPAAGVIFSDRIETARHIVRTLKETEEVDAIVVIGHALYEDDLALARAVPGIDLIFGTHSHRKEELKRIPGTNTWIISPSQYLTYISHVTLEFVDRTLTAIDGGLVRMDRNIPQDSTIINRVAHMESDLEADPAYSHLFEPIGFAEAELSISGQFYGESILGNLVSDLVRQTTDSHAAILTSSSFRQAIPPGTILEQDLLAALPYKNNIYLFEMSGAQIKELLDYSVSQIGSDNFSQVSGLRFDIREGQAANIQILNDQKDKNSGYAAINDDRMYQIATSDYQAQFARGYKRIFSSVESRDTGIDIWTVFRNYLATNTPLKGQTDGRIKQDCSSQREEFIHSPITLALVSLGAIVILLRLFI